MNKKKNKKLPVIQKYPLGGFINNTVTKGAEALGVNPKAAQIIGSGVAAATGLIPGMQDNFLQAGDLTGDIMNTSGNKKVSNAGQNISALSPLLNYIPMAYGGELGDPPMITPMDNPDDFTVQTKAAPYAWNLKNYKEQTQQVITGIDPTTGQPIYSQVDRTPRIIAHGKNLLNSLKGNTNATVATQFAMGGSMDGLVEFQGGTGNGSHEEGGIPLGNSQIEVEANETKSKDYIYSDRIKLPWNKKKTFADESKRISAKYKGREEDALAKKTMQVELDKLRGMQETTKQDMVQKAQKMMSNAGMHTMPDGSMMPDDMMAYGGKMYYPDGGTFSLVDNVDTTQNPFIEEGVNYSPQEQIVMQGLANQLNSGQIDKPTYDAALAEMGQGSMGSVRQDDGSIKSYWEDKYPDMFGNTGTEGQSSAANLTQQTPSNAGTRMGQAGVGSNTPTNNTTGNSTFNEGLTTGQKLMPYLPVLGQAATLIGGAEKTKFNQMTPEFIDLKAQRTGVKKAGAEAKSQNLRNIRNIAGNSGRGLSNMVASNTGIYSSTADQLSNSYMTEANTNSQISNQADQFNTNIQNQEVIANEQNNCYTCKYSKYLFWNR
jgi:hypothetical protein